MQVGVGSYTDQTTYITYHSVCQCDVQHLVRKLHVGHDSYSHRLYTQQTTQHTQSVSAKCTLSGSSMLALAASRRAMQARRPSKSPSIRPLAAMCKGVCPSCKTAHKLNELLMSQTSHLNVKAPLQVSIHAPTDCHVQGSLPILWKQHTS